MENMIGDEFRHVKEGREAVDLASPWPAMGTDLPSALFIFLLWEQVYMSQTR